MRQRLASCSAWRPRLALAWAGAFALLAAPDVRAAGDATPALRSTGAGVVELRALDGAGRRVDPMSSHVSMQRTPPERLGDDSFADHDDPDALRFVALGRADDMPTTLTLLSLDEQGRPLDAIRDVPLGHVRCPEDVSAATTCGSTRPIRAVGDEVDRNHPLVRDRSIRVDLGGALVLLSPAGDPLQTLRVGGPRHSALGPIVRYRARLRMFLVRLRPGGPAPIGGDDAEAIALARGEVARANTLWGACGIGFGPPGEVEVRVVDPPPPHLLALGCDHGLPAAGGAVRFRVEGKDIEVRVPRGAKPDQAARLVALALRAAGHAATVSDNRAIHAGVSGSSDVLVRRRDGQLATLEPPATGKLTTDARLTVCLGRVDLEDGLQHFGDIDAAAGTVEERALIKAFDDGDPSTIEVLVVPSFAGAGRIGESFIQADGGAIRNAIVADRASLRAGRASFALAHELGHVLLDEPGHPDDFGADTPTRLMDADAANLSAYGPRRLLVEECERALRQSGPGSPAPTLRPWPLAKLPEPSGKRF